MLTNLRSFLSQSECSSKMFLLYLNRFVIRKITSMCSSRRESVEEVLAFIHGSLFLSWENSVSHFLLLD